MKFSCDKAVLSAAVSNVSRAVTTRTALQALEGILIRAEGDTLTAVFSLPEGGGEHTLAFATSGALEAGRITVTAQ